MEDTRNKGRKKKEKKRPNRLSRKVKPGSRYDALNLRQQTLVMSKQGRVSISFLACSKPLSGTNSSLTKLTAEAGTILYFRETHLFHSGREQGTRTKTLINESETANAQTLVISKAGSESASALAASSLLSGTKSSLTAEVALSGTMPWMEREKSLAHGKGWHRGTPLDDHLLNLIAINQSWQTH